MFAGLYTALVTKPKLCESVDTENRHIKSDRMLQFFYVTVVSLQVCDVTVAAF